MNHSLVILAVLVVTSNANAAIENGGLVTADFIRGQGYFETLDYNRPEVSKKIPELESLYVGLIPLLREQVDSHAIDAPTAALANAYIAMYLVNTGYGIKNGKLSPDSIRPIEPSRDEVVLSLLEEANRLDPTRGTIQTWLAGERARISGGAELEALIERVKADPVFSLFAALILERDFDFTPEQKDAIFAQVLKMTSKDSPCRSSPCGVSPYVPYSQQASGLYLGDAYLRKGAELLNDGDAGNDKRARGYIAMALLMFESPKLKPRSALTTFKWKHRKELRKRFSLAGKVLLTRKPAAVDAYFKTEAAIQPYQCAACHSK